MKLCSNGACFAAAQLSAQLINHAVNVYKLNCVYFTSAIGIEHGLGYILKRHNIASPDEHELGAYLGVLPDEYKDTEWYSTLAGVTSSEIILLNEYLYSDEVEASRDTVKSLVHVNQLLADFVMAM